jgi:hypothetical protein
LLLIARGLSHQFNCPILERKGDSFRRAIWASATVVETER